MNDVPIQAAILLLVLILPLSALVARRVPFATTLKYGAIWLTILAILAAAMLIFT